MLNYNLLTVIFLSCLCNSCTDSSYSSYDLNTPLYSTISKDKSNIDFVNLIEETTNNNVLTNNYLFAGGGVAVGDINNDGLQDVFFVSNEKGEHGLYLNKGNLNFENITQKSQILSAEGWNNGVTMIDINQDGYLDIYICRGGEHIKEKGLRSNLLYINNKDLTFTESASIYGLDDSNKSTMAVFFDYDNDWDLDVYILNIPERQRADTITVAELNLFRTSPQSYEFANQSTDKLFRNDGNKTFTDVTNSSGIFNYGFGLGISICDLNKDNKPDIYITNDFDVDDFYYENNGDGTFNERASFYLKHVSYFAMGVDIADLDNDGHTEIFEVEMLPEKRERSVVNMESMNRKKFEQLVSGPMNPQYMRNSLQKNQGYGMMSEIAQYAGVAKTDWSWGTLLIDLDDDGLKDIYVTNGILKDFKDRDMTKVGNKKAEDKGGNLSIEEHQEIFKTTPIENKSFENIGNLKFEKKFDDWGLNYKGFSNGLVYSDLDNDQDLDLIINNLNESPIIFKNSSIERGQNSINFKFKGIKQNKNGVGCKVTILTENGIQYSENFQVRGFQSSSENIVHFGLGKLTKIEKAEIVWPDGMMQVIKDINKVNQTILVDRKNAINVYQRPKTNNLLFTGASKTLGLAHRHEDYPFDDFETEILLPHKMSQLGPSISVGDLNNDKLDDFFIGNGKGREASIYLMDKYGVYSKSNSKILDQDRKYEDIGSCFFDKDNDGDLDLYVVSGSNEDGLTSENYQDRLYENDGKGNFISVTKKALPKINFSGSCVVAADYDNDGDQDLFVGGRLKPQNYPESSSSMLLKNNNGIFESDKKNPILNSDSLGMITSAVWSDYDKDGDPDLVLVGEWEPIRIFENENGILKDKSSSLNLDNTSGWWFKIHEVDINNDGFMDFVAGNIGLNHKFHGSKEKPFMVYKDDFDENGTSDIFLAFHQDEKIFPVRGRDCSSEQMPILKEKFPTFHSFGNATIDDLLGDKKNASYQKQIEQMASVILINNQGKGFEIKELPYEAQLSSLNGIQHYDIDKDGWEDLLLVGNMNQTEAETSRADASVGLILINDQNNFFTPLTMHETGWYCPGDAKDLKIVYTDLKTPFFLVANNNQPLQTFQLAKNKQRIK